MTVESPGRKLLQWFKTRASSVFLVLAILAILSVINCSAVEPPPPIAHDIGRKVSLGGHASMMIKASVRRADIAKIWCMVWNALILSSSLFKISNL